MKVGEYVLSKRFLSFLGNYRLADEADKTIMRFVGHFRLALRFDALESDGRVAFRGQGKLLDGRNSVSFSRSGQAFGSMQADWEAIKTSGSQIKRYLISGGTGETMHTQGDCATVWSLMNRDREIARVERRGRKWHISLFHTAYDEFVLTVVVAIVHMTLGDERTLGTDG